MRLRRLGYGVAVLTGLAVIAQISGGIDALSTLYRQGLRTDHSAKFNRILERALAVDGEPYAAAQSSMENLQREMQTKLGAPQAIAIAAVASWLRQAHRDSEASVRFWAPVAQCVASGDCLPGPRHVGTCVDLSRHLGRLSEASGDLKNFVQASKVGLNGPGFALADLHSMEAVLADGCERVPVIAQAVGEARKADTERRVAAIRKAWDNIRAAPTMEAVQRYVALYDAEQAGNKAEVDRLLHALEDREKLVTNGAFCGSMRRAVERGTSGRSLVVALTQASVKPAYCVTDKGAATCGWLDLLEQPSEAYQTGASFRADALVAAMQGCAPAKGETARETYEDLNNPGCPAERRAYSSGDLNISVVVSHCRFAQLRVWKVKTG